MSTGLSEVRALALKVILNADFRSKVRITSDAGDPMQMQDIYSIPGRGRRVARLRREVESPLTTGVSFTTTNRVTHHFKF